MPSSRGLFVAMIFGGLGLGAWSLAQAGAPVPPLSAVDADHPSLEARAASAASLGSVPSAAAARLQPTTEPWRALGVLQPDPLPPIDLQAFRSRDSGRSARHSEVPDLAALLSTQWSSHTLRDGDSLGALWHTAWGLRMSALYRILSDAEEAQLLNRVHAGQHIEWQLDPDGQLQRLRFWDRPDTGHEWSHQADTDTYTYQTIEAARTVTHWVFSGQVRHETATALTNPEEPSHAKAVALSHLLEPYLPLQEQARAGDQYALVIEKETLVNDDAPYAVRLLAFDYTGQLIDASAVRHADERFYTWEGSGLQPPFERYPFEGEHPITSDYDAARRHPITGRVTAHLGTDFAMPKGTPIIAPADGTVIRVGSHPVAGRFLEIEHSQGFTTRYLHLERAVVDEGQQIERGEQIALSGNSGRTTAPHLHYELHVEGQPVDAMRVDLPVSEALVGPDLEDFQQVAQPLLAELQNTTASRQMAMQSSREPGW